MGTINQYGADVFDYDKDIMVMEALFIHDENDQDLTVNKDKNKRYFQYNDNAICLEQLEPALAYWGIQMDGLYKFDITMAEREVAMNKDFIENNPWISQFMH